MANKVTKAELSEFKKNKDSVKEFSNGEVTVFWKSELCIHSANCLIGLPNVFNSKKKPWINVHASNSKEIMKIVGANPATRVATIEYEGDVDNPIPALKKCVASLRKAM